MMVNDKLLQEKLNGIFFTIIADISNYSTDQLLVDVMDGIKGLLNTKYEAIYLYNYWNKRYELVNEQENSNQVPCHINDGQFMNRLNDNLPFSIHGNDIFKRNGNTFKSFIIPLNPKYEPVGFMLLSFAEHEQILSEKHCDILKDVLEKFLSLLNCYNLSKDNDKKNQFLFDLTSRFYSSINKKDILTEITKALKLLYPDFTYYLLLSQDYEVNNLLPVKLIEYSDDATKRVSTQAFITGEIQLEDRVKEMNTCFYAPLKGSQGVYGVLQIITPKIMDFPKKEIAFITRFANVAGQAIENATLYQHSTHLVSDLKLINEVTHKLNSNLQLSEIISIVKQQIFAACQAEQIGFIYYNQESDDKFDILSGSTVYFNSQQGMNFSEFMIDQLHVNNEPVFSGDLSAEFAGLPFKSIMAIPMQQYSTVHGAVIIMHKDAYYFSFENFKLIQSLIQHSTLALSNSILRDKLERAAITDYLTKLYSRSYLDERIQLHMDTDEQGALVLFDIDDFKQVNDTYGHHVGDEVIKQVANIIMTHSGKDDVPARWGGEELAIYLPNASIEDGVQLASQIRKQTENFTDPMITLSCGVSTWTNKTANTVQDVFIRADKALYEAKSVGKNCVVKGNHNPAVSYRYSKS